MPRLSIATRVPTSARDAALRIGAALTTPCAREFAIGILLLPLVLGIWTLAGFRSLATFPVDAIPTILAGRVWAAGHPDAVYHPTVWLVAGQIHPAWTAEAARLGLSMPDTSFVYSPVYLWLVRPLTTLLGPKQFLWVVTLSNAAAALVLGYQSARLLTHTTPAQRRGIALLVSASFPATYAALLGQNVLVAAALVLLGFRWLSEAGARRWLGLGALLLACAFKHWCLPLLVVPLLLRRWREGFAGLGAYAVCFLALPRWLLPEVLWQGHQSVLAKLPGVSVLAFNNVSLRALIQRTSFPGWPYSAREWNASRSVDGWPLALEVALVLGVGLTFAILVWRKRPSTLHAGVGAMAVVLFALGICWSHYLVFALPLVVLVLGDPNQARWLRIGAGLTALWLMRGMVGFPPWPQDMRPPAAWAWALSGPLLLTTSLALGWLWRLPRPPDRAPSPTPPRSERSGAATASAPGVLPADAASAPGAQGENPAGR